MIEWHHVLPLSWGGEDHPANKIQICAQTHYATHYILNIFVRLGAQVSRNKSWPSFAYQLAVTAWSQRIPGHSTPMWRSGPLADQFKEPG